MFLELASHTKHTAVCPPTRDTSQRINILRCAPRNLYFWMMSFELCLNYEPGLDEFFFFFSLLLNGRERVAVGGCSLFHEAAAVIFDGR